MSLPSYSKYKGSSDLWYEFIPEQWKALHLKRVSRLITGLTPPTENQKNYTQNSDLPWVRPEDLTENGLTVASKFLSDEGWALCRQVQPGATLVCCIGTIGKLGFVDQSVSTNQQITAVEFAGSDRYGFYVLRAAREQIELLSTGNVLRIINSERLGNLSIPYPSLPEQTQIARFLDHEAAKIDTLIHEQKRLIELLKEKRQAVISHAVTKGLDPDVSMKDSGVEWLGEVPAHWNVARLKHVIRATGGSTPSKEHQEYWDGDIPWVSPKDMKKSRISGSTDHVSDKALEDTGLSLIRIGSVLIVVRGMILAHSVPVAITEVAVTINQDMKALEAGPELSPDYLLLLLSGIKDAVFEYIDSSAHGTKKLEWERFEGIQLPIPPLEDQRYLASKTEKLIEKIDDLSNQASGLTRLLQERRSALISAAVTGKIDVRNWQLPVDESVFDEKVRQTGLGAGA